MSQEFGSNSMSEYGRCPETLSEPESYTEHQAALDATLFRPDRDGDELVLELEAGELRIRRAL